MERSQGQKLADNIAQIAAYTAGHPELSRAHHFLYDLRYPKHGSPKIVVMGVNPGETEYDWTIAPTPTEETSRYDFHTEEGGGRSAIRWSSAARYFLDGVDYVLAEIFLWSSYDSRTFTERFGPLAKSPHLPFCTAMNRDLIEVYQPSVIVLPGLTHAKVVKAQYGLEHIETVYLGNSRVAERFTDGQRPWIFTKHWTAAFGFSTAQREAARQVIRFAK